MSQSNKSKLALAINELIYRQRQSVIMSNNWAGFADAKPSESIQQHDLPGLCVASVFPFMHGVALFDVPVKQYKDITNIKKKINSARRLTYWLWEQKLQGLNIFGFCLTQTQLTAANYGLRLLEEIPGIEIKPHYGKYRLYFGDHHIDFSQAVALIYYLLAAYFSILRPSILAKNNELDLVLYMDRFPGASVGDIALGIDIPKTDGKRFVEYVQDNSPTCKGIEEDHKSNNLNIALTTIDRWSKLGSDEVLAGKEHPHFILPDWLAVASIATAYRGEFIASYSSHRHAVVLADECTNLYKAFKSFDIWSFEESVLNHLIGGETMSVIPDDAKEFILDRASR